MLTNRPVPDEDPHVQRTEFKAHLKKILGMDDRVAGGVAAGGINPSKRQPTLDRTESKSYLYDIHQYEQRER